MVLFFNILDVSATNILAVWMEVNPGWKQEKFFKRSSWGISSGTPHSTTPTPSPHTSFSTLITEIKEEDHLLQEGDKRKRKSRERGVEEEVLYLCTKRCQNTRHHISKPVILFLLVVH
ncbi:hypothetical protein XENOCAPTIV_025277 [Xenoophorus captivus]|uniref:Uncharacterized protein n=1 Tax=Xenoophorus captivus TaxID=1517983 RepID=A0ABV0RU71_9TELE